MPDEKFIDYFIEQSENVAPDGSIYWVAVDQISSELKYIKSTLIKKVEWGKENIINLIKCANKYDKLILHSFFFSNLNFFLDSLRKDIEVVWMFWGGDGYNFTSHIKRWYQPLTWQYKKQILKENSGRIKRHFCKMNMARQTWIQSRITRRMIRRVNICATWIKYDYEMIRYINPKMKWMYYSYFVTTQMGLDILEYQPININRLWLGNSATDTNNHFDALYFLNEINWQGEIIVPLSYGNKSYTEKVLRTGEKYFGVRFIPLTDFIPLEQYHQIMNSCGIVWMNHIRQQAAGNTIAALYMGKAVIMNTNNSLYKTLTEWGVHFAEQKVLNNCDLKEIDKYIFSSNKNLILNHLSKEKNIGSLKAMYKQ
jgi:hypothetical protein